MLLYLHERIRKMKYFSTRDAEKNSFDSAVVIKKGLASDGGLFVPDALPSLTKEEIDEAIDASAKKPLPDLSDRRRRTMIYKAVTDSMKCELVLLLVRALYERRQALALEGKRMAFSDSEMLARCELSVAAEFAFSLGIEKSEVGTYIQNRFEQMK